MSSGSITNLIRPFKDGDPEAVDALWNRYMSRLVSIGKQNLQDAPRRAVDEEDVAQSAFHNFVQKARNGDFQKLDNRDDMWRLLVTITIRKANKVYRREKRREVVEGSAALLETLVKNEPTPEFICELRETVATLINSLSDQKLQEIALAKLEGLTTREIAERIGRSTPTVERKVRLIREAWRGLDLQ